MMMSAADYRDSLRSLSPRVFVDGERVDSVADEPRLRPGINAIGVTYDFARDPAHVGLACARGLAADSSVNRFLALNRCGDDLLAKLEYTRLARVYRLFCKNVDTSWPYATISV